MQNGPINRDIYVIPPRECSGTKRRNFLAIAKLTVWRHRSGTVMCYVNRDLVDKLNGICASENNFTAF